MSTYSSELSDTSGSETTPPPMPTTTANEIKKKKRKPNFDGGKLLKYYKYLYEQKCKESDHYKKLYRAKNKECEQLTLLNQQYQGRVIAYLLESHTNNASSYASSISSSSQNDVCLRDADYNHESNDVDDLITTMHDSDNSHQTAQSQLHSNGSNDDDTMNLNSVKNYDFVVDVSTENSGPVCVCVVHPNLFSKFRSKKNYKFVKFSLQFTSGCLSIFNTHK